MLNLPNKITLIRVFMIPVFLIFAIEPSVLPNSYIKMIIENNGMMIAGVIFITLFATDALDGYIARKYKLVTDFGKFLDPIADKLLVTSALLALISRGEIGAWMPVIIISREYIVTGLRLIGANKGIVLAAGSLGKAKTVSQFAALCFIFFSNFNLTIFVDINAGVILLYAATILTIVSGVDYIIKNRKLFI